MILTPSSVTSTSDSVTPVESKEQEQEQVTSSQKNSDQARNVIQLFNPREAASRAEILLCIDMIINKNSFSSYSSKKELYQSMFPNAVPVDFSISPAKMAYLVTEAAGPYFKNMLLQELKDSNVKFTLQFDETGNVKSSTNYKLELLTGQHLKIKFAIVI